MSLFTPATKARVKARIAIDGPSGAGKTLSALRIAKGLAGPDGRVALLDTEYDSALLYDHVGFDHASIRPPYTIAKYEAGIWEAAEAGYDVLIIDTITHAWKGEGGVLDLVESKKRGGSNTNEFAAWRHGDQAWGDLLKAILAADLHVIVTMRSKQEYALQESDRGKKEVVKLGMAPEARSGVEYEFAIVLSLDLRNVAQVTKTRWSAIAGAEMPKPDEDLGARIGAWLSDASADAPATHAVEIANVSVDTQTQVSRAIMRAVEAGVDVDEDKIRAYAWRSEANATKAVEELDGRVKRAQAQDSPPDATKGAVHGPATDGPPTRQSDGNGAQEQALL